MKFEDFVTNQSDVFARLSPFLTEPAAKFEELRASTKNEQKDSSYYADYYGNEVWKDEYPAIRSIERPDEGDLFPFFGYP